MSLPRIVDREINGYVNKAVDKYVDDNQKPSIFDDFDRFAQILGRKIDLLFQQHE